MTSEIWTETFRPSTFKEMVGQEDIVNRVEALANSLNIPHLLFAGPAGTGKSTLALIVVKELFKNTWKDNYLEADALTPEAQQALRRTMENYSTTCRFILSCNYSSKIIDPIQSRCAIFRFKLLENKAIGKVIDRIAKTKDLSISPGTYEILYEGCEGDCRRCINLLQATAAISPAITPELISTIISNAKPKDIKVVLEYALSGDFKNSREKLLDVMLKAFL